MPRDWEIPDADEYEDEEDEFGPGSADYDLSEEHGYMWEPKREHWPVPPWLLITVSIIVIVALVLPSVIILLR
jgi:hypothetical protein